MALDKSEKEKNNYILRLERWYSTRTTLMSCSSSDEETRVKFSLIQSI